ncbi:pentatricopeptide repeat-containing protein At1g08070, chloroplastic-like [Macadamia integrifolia]|uniref:pentatricopeptide repeat-containing protein At1g08070, chloroplastic-like n=1 Tax=Macadamia integrifolia TaxID=60698 RepID=UPI001C4E3930|nr:pentatricopeptide repeat-containing protein At1g08070, chloroplastic-like [Macadamia integrifolia]XP_042497144.1 pentatricopeptide repeat-containing protein At1g08070, chloroplastic-like [Macadamia integrifolia]
MFTVSLFPALSMFTHYSPSSRLFFHLTHTSSVSSSSCLRDLSLLLQGNVLHSHLQQIHARIYRIGADQNDLITTRLIGRYPIQSALRVFCHLQKPNIFPYNAIIRVFSESDLFIEAFSLFKALKFQSLLPNDFTFSFLLKACNRSEDSRNIQQIHTHIVKLGFDCDSVVCNGLLAAYIKGVRDLVSGRRVFDEMPQKRIVCSWTSLISGYAQMGRSKEALVLFLRMVEDNLMPENDTMVSILSACSSLEIGEIQRWEKLLLEFSCDDDNNVKNTHSDFIDIVLIYLCGKLGRVEKSRELFDKLAEGVRRRSVLPWNAIINGYVQNGRHMDALSVFRLMVEGFNPKPNHVTMVSVLSACAEVGDLSLGRWVHEYVKTNGRKCILESNTLLATAFIDMYSKCGSPKKAREVFDRMATKDVISFNAMIMGLAINGQGEDALRLFSTMEDFGIYPNDTTFLGVLYACNHSGLVEAGRCIFQDMGQCYSITPKVEHYASYIDLLARVGHLEEALEVFTSMLVKPNAPVFGALLGGCVVHSRLDLAQHIARRLVEVDPDNSAGYVMLSNIYAVNRQWDNITELRESMRERGVKKQPGCSWISINGVVHEFLVGSTSHHQIETIYCTLDGLLKEMKLFGS